jgi:hypothetical protein
MILQNGPQTKIMSTSAEICPDLFQEPKVANGETLSKSNNTEEMVAYKNINNIYSTPLNF